MTWAARLLASFIALPRWVHLVLGGLAVFAVWLHFHDRAVIRDHEAGIERAAQARASAGAEAARGEIEQSRNEVEQANANARDAAARSPDDPLRAGLDRLRADRADKPATR